MAEERKIALNWKTILLFIIIILVLLSTGLFGGYRWAKKQEAVLIDTFSYKIDSINKINQIYMDSITRLSAQEDEAIRYITIWRTKYDTIRPKEDVDNLIKGLNEVGKTSPK